MTLHQWVQHVAFTLAFVTHAGKTGTRQTGHPCCSWAKQQKTMVPSEIVRRQRNPASPSFAHHDLCCPLQPAAGTRPPWGEPTVFTHLWGPTPVMGLFVQVAVQGAVKISTLGQKLAVSELQSQVCPKVRLWWLCLPKKSYFKNNIHYFYSSCSR